MSRDLKKELGKQYKPSVKPESIIMPPLQYLMLDGQGRPGNEDFQLAVQALFGVSYKDKFILKKREGLDYTVMPLEGLWWADNLKDFENDNRDNLKWTMMILQPKWVTQPVVKEAIEQARKKSDNPCLYKLRLENVEEGLCGQILHIGPFLEEHATILKLHKFISDQKGQFDGKVQKHHEIYLSDIRRVAPEKYRTIIRQPYTQ
ncbi:GyrI-like domain-containing protein [candidate division KSB1 bacterium]|nr:GyrI-like domain-containing protein [candidate division KSB1 bacterium]